MDAGRRAELLPPQADRGEQQDHRVERVLAPPRVGRRVRLEAGVDDVDVLGRQRLALDVAPVAGVVEQRRVETLEQAVLDHDLLAAAPLLGGRAEEDDLAGQLVGHRREGDRGADTRGGHRVVAAAVAEAGQGVVLGEDPDPRAVAATTAAAASHGPRSRGCRPDARPRSRGGSAPRRPRPRHDLLERRLGIGVDPMRQVEDLVAGRLDGGGERGPCRSAYGAAGRDGGQSRTRGPPAAGRDGRGGDASEGLSVPCAAGPRVSVPRTASPRPRAPARS